MNVVRAGVNLTAKNFECAAANSTYRYLITILSAISIPAINFTKEVVHTGLDDERDDSWRIWSMRELKSWWLKKKFNHEDLLLHPSGDRPLRFKSKLNKSHYINNQ